MKIFHGVIEIAGQMGIMCGELKRRGHLAVGYNIFQSYLGYKEHLVNTSLTEIQLTNHHIVNFFDLFHFHYASSMLPGFKDLEIIRGKRKKMVMHHWGNDVRFHDQARRNNPFVYTGDSPANDAMRMRLTQIGRYIDEAIVQDYEVYEYVKPFYKKVHVVPISIDLSRITPVFPNKAVKRPLIVHAPTNPEFKGTLAIESAIAQLQKTYGFDYRRIQNMNHTEALRLFHQADVIVDQIRCGSHGLLSVEAMALGKPVIAYIRPDLQSKFPAELPVLSANPDTITAKIRYVLEHPDIRPQLGAQGRAYAEKYHDRKVVVPALEHIYAQLRS